MALPVEFFEKFEILCEEYDADAICIAADLEDHPQHSGLHKLKFQISGVTWVVHLMEDHLRYLMRTPVELDEEYEN